CFRGFSYGSKGVPDRKFTTSGEKATNPTGNGSGLEPTTQGRDTLPGPPAAAQFRIDPRIRVYVLGRDRRVQTRSLFPSGSINCIIRSPGKSSFGASSTVMPRAVHWAYQ